MIPHPPVRTKRHYHRCSNFKCLQLWAHADDPCTVDRDALCPRCEQQQDHETKLTEP